MLTLRQLINLVVGWLAYWDKDISAGEKKGSLIEFLWNNHVASNYYVSIEGNTAPPHCHRAFSNNINSWIQWFCFLRISEFWGTSFLPHICFFLPLINVQLLPGERMDKIKWGRPFGGDNNIIRQRLNFI